MSDENLSDVLDDKADYLAYKKQKTIEKLGERTHLTLGKIAKLVGHEEHGAIVGDITLQDLIDVQLEKQLEEAVAAKLEEVGSEVAVEDEEEAPRPVAKKKATKKKVAKKKVAKKAAKKKATKAPAAKKKSVKKRSVAASASGGKRKADYGKTKPRLKRDQGYKEILAALKAAGEPCGRGDLEEATGYTGVQVRTFCKELAAMSPPKVQILGKGGRSTKYALA